MSLSYRKVNDRLWTFFKSLLLLAVTLLPVVGQLVLAWRPEEMNANYHFYSSYVLAASLSFLLFTLWALILAGVNFRRNFWNKGAFVANWSYLIPLILLTIVEVFFFFLILDLNLRFAHQSYLGVLAVVETVDGSILRSVGVAGGLMDSLVFGFLVLMTWPFEKERQEVKL